MLVEVFSYCIFSSPG